MASSKFNSSSIKIEDEDDWEYFDDSVYLTDFWSSLIEGGTPEDPLDQWFSAFESKSIEDSCFISNPFFDYWRIMVPRLLSYSHGKTSLDQKWPEDKIYSALIKPLEAFIVGSYDEIENKFKELNNLESGEFVCGKMFRNGEPCYSCRDCAQDNTCVMCAPCFEASIHKTHRYKMATSYGGGYCDCGDREAFHHGFICDLHSSNRNEDQNSSFSLDPTLTSRTKEVLRQIIRYVFKMTNFQLPDVDWIIGKKEKETWPELEYTFKYSNYAVVLYNDDVHSYNDVIRTLKKALHITCSRRLAADITSFVDKNGRIVLKVGNYSDCTTLNSRIESNSRLDNMALKCSVLPSYVVAHQNFAARLLSWLSSRILSKIPAFQRIFSSIAFDVSDHKYVIELGGVSYSFVEAILFNDSKIWKEIRSLWLQILIDGIMKNYESKKRLAEVFGHHYSSILQSYVNDDQEAELSICSLSLQIFTVPSLSHHLLETMNILTDMMTTFYDYMSIYEVKNDSGKGSGINLHEWQEYEKSEFVKAQSIIQHIRYLLSVVPNSFSPSLRQHFLSGVEVLIKSLILLQGMDAQKRHVDAHVEYDSSEWEGAYRLTEVFTSVSELVSKWCRYDKGLLTGVLNLLLTKCILTVKGNTILQNFSFLNESRSYQIIDYHVGRDPVSSHVPLHRLLATLLPSFNNFPSEDLVSQVRHRLESYLPLHHLLDPVLNTIVAISQINVGLWKRNGTASLGLAYIYSHHALCPSLKRNDLILFQSIVSLSEDPGRFVIALLHRFDLLSWAFENEVPYSEEIFGLADEFLSFILAMIGERYSTGIGQNISEEDEMRHRIVQILCTNDLPHSVLNSLLPSSNNEKLDVDALIRQVSNSEKQIIQCKDECLSQFNLFFYYYTREQQSAAYETQMAIRKKRNQTFIPPPSNLPPYSALYEGLRNLPISLPLQKLIISFLKRPLSDRLENRILHKILFLISIAIQDDLRDGIPIFTKAFESLHLVNILSKAASVSEEHKDLISHVVNQLNEARRVLCNIEISEVLTSDESYLASEEDRNRKVKAAALRRSEILAQMNQLQKKFANEYKMDLEELENDDEEYFKENVATEELKKTPQRAVGPLRSTSHPLDKKYKCILCQEDSLLSVAISNDALIIAAYVQKTSILSGEFQSKKRGTCDEDFLPMDLSCGPHVSSCGHVMHTSCYQKYFDSLVAKEQSTRRAIRPIQNYDVMLNEYICPICERLSNSVLPLIPPLSYFSPLLSSSTESFDSWINNIKGILKHKIIRPSSSENVESSILSRLTLDDSMLHSITSNKNSSLPKSLNDMCTTHAMTIFTKTLSINPWEGDYRILQMLIQGGSLSLSAFMAKRESSEFISERETETIIFLLRLCLLFPNTSTGKANSQFFLSNALYVLSLLLSGSSEEDSLKNFCHFDAFFLLLLLLSSHSILEKNTTTYSNIGKYDHHILRLVYLFHLHQISFGLQESDESQEDSDDTAVNRILVYLGNIRPFKGSGRALRKKSLRFLHSSAFLFHSITDVSFQSKESFTFEELCFYLSLPSDLSSLLNEPSSRMIGEALMSHSSLKNMTNISLPLVRRNLISLPQDYVCLLNKAADYRCYNNVTGESKSVVLCLICGDLICSQSHCCQSLLENQVVGGCTSHARHCGADVGIFLNLRDCQILVLVDMKRGALLFAPYVDEHGEHDSFLKRGNPLFLDSEKYNELNRYWLNNEIPDRISRSFDQDILIFTTDWHTF